MVLRSTRTRRDFILAGTAAGGGVLLAGLTGTAMSAEKPADKSHIENTKPEEEISPAEDLMREHGLLERILLIYEESIRRLNNNVELNVTALLATAKIVRSFIEDYHSKLEEDHVFPRFEKAGKLVDIVKLLRGQHEAGRRATDRILLITTFDKILLQQNCQKLIDALMQFIRMYRPHLAREDTVVFPAMRSVTTPEDYDAMGEQFEDREHELFGEKGFENVVEQVAGLEKTMGIYDLSKFTAKL